MMYLYLRFLIKLLLLYLVKLKCRVVSFPPTNQGSFFVESIPFVFFIEFGHNFIPITLSQYQDGMGTSVEYLWDTSEPMLMGSFSIK